MLKVLQNKAAEGEGALPLAVRSWLKQQHAIETTNAQAEWSEDEVYLGMPKPGGDAWLSIDLTSGELLYENTSRGAISYLRSEEHTSELQSRPHLVCRLLLEKKKKK